MTGNKVDAVSERNLGFKINFDDFTTSKGATLGRKEDFDELMKAAYNGATGYVSPPEGNVMGFGPKSNA